MSCLTSCEYKGTPLRLVNGNLGVLYLALALATVVMYCYAGGYTINTFDKNLYSLRNGYAGSQPIVNAVASPVIAPNTPTYLIIAMMLFVTNMLFHFGYAIDYKRAYTVMLVDRCNKLRWIQFAITVTLIGLFAAQVTGTESFDFALAALFFLPIMGVFGYIMEKTFPCYPGMFWISYIGLFAILAAYWSPVITNLSIHANDSRTNLSYYIYAVAAAFFLFNLIIIFIPYIQSRTRIQYSTIELIHSFLMFGLCAVMFGLLSWAIIESP